MIKDIINIRRLREVEGQTRAIQDNRVTNEPRRRTKVFNVRPSGEGKLEGREQKTIMADQNRVVDVDS